LAGRGKGTWPAVPLFALPVLAYAQADAPTALATGLATGPAAGQEDDVIAILLTVCLINQPTTCRHDKIALVAGISVIQCMMTAPPHIAKWSEDHPGWHVERWQCGDASRQDI